MKKSKGGDAREIPWQWALKSMPFGHGDRTRRRFYVCLTTSVLLFGRVWRMVLGMAVSLAHNAKNVYLGVWVHAYGFKRRWGMFSKEEILRKSSMICRKKYIRMEGFAAELGTLLQSPDHDQAILQVPANNALHISGRDRCVAHICLARLDKTIACLKTLITSPF